jgi:mannose/cellobiose epimerase-like protein (N-acyl-D-glucosamine 2-epimerase family)
MRPALVLLFAVAAAATGAEPPLAAATTPPSALPAFKASLRDTMTRHLDLLLGPDGSARALKGKTANGHAAFAFYLMFELTGNPAYRRAAIEIADRILRDMRPTSYTGKAAAARTSRTWPASSIVIRGRKRAGGRRPSM